MVQTSADPYPWRVHSPQPRSRYWAPVLSVLLHLLLAFAWLGFPLPDPQPKDPPSISVDIVPPPQPAPATPAVAPSQPAPQAPKNKPAEQGVPVPQLAEGELAPKSTPPSETESKKPSPPDPAASQPSPKTKKPAPITQNQRDWVLSRVLKHWRRPPDMGPYANGTISLAVKVTADGYFSDIYDARRAWNPNDVFDGYAALPPSAVQRRIIDSVYGAIRQAQPMKLSQELRDRAPFEVRLDFRFKDVR